MTSVRWHPLRSGDPAQTILAIDYGVGRREAGFPELAPNLAVPGAVMATHFSPAEVVELARNGAADPAAIRSELRGWADDLLAEPDTAPRAILSYCAGATPACVLADELALRGFYLPVIMLDPLIAEPEFLLGRFAEAAQGLAAILDDKVVEDAIREAAVENRRATEITGRAVLDSSEALSGRYRTLVYQACTEAELGDEAAEELHAHLAGVLHYQAVTALAGTAGLWGPDGARDMTVFLSEDHPDAAPFPAATSTFGVSRDAFLADPTLAAAVSEAINKT